MEDELTIKSKEIRRLHSAIQTHRQDYKKTLHDLMAIIDTHITETTVLNLKTVLSTLRFEILTALKTLES